MRRHLTALMILGWLLAATVKNPDSPEVPPWPQGWPVGVPLEFTFYFITVDGWDAADPDNPAPLYSARTPTRTYVWPQLGCGPMGANACVRFDNDPAPGDVWMYEETPEWCCRKLDGAP